jgi:MFS family permease
LVTLQKGSVIMTAAVRGHRSVATAHQRALLHDRIAICLAFGVAGATLGAWTARIPAVQQHLLLSDGQLSVALLALATGGLIGMRTSGRFVDRYGHAAVMVPAALLLGSALALTAYATALPTLMGVLLALGLCHGTLNTSMNVAAVACQTAYQRPIMSFFHAQYSIGGAAGALGVAACTRAHAGTPATFAIIATLLIVMAVVAVRCLNPVATRQGTAGQGPPGTDTARSGAARGRAGSRRTTLLLGLLALCSLLCEGAAADWSSVYLTQIGAPSSIAAAGYAAFAGSMTLGRLAGDRITTHVAPLTLLRGCGLLAGAGLAAGLVAKTPVAVILGFASLGAGLSCVVPQLYSTAGTLDPSRPGGALSRVAALGYAGYVSGPLVIGGLAAHAGLGHALLLLPVLAAFLVLGAPVAVPALTAPKHLRNRGREPSLPPRGTQYRLEPRPPVDMAAASSAT